ncbi:MAG TPA: lamin tail domain-containing protein [Treponemataceae bacterium]|nr:lamin tail domain-containing protein [Treponemataceae bacterium]
MYQFNTMKKASGFLLCCLFVFSCSLSLSEKTPPSLVINEVMSSNYQLIYDKDCNSSDWVEILNTGDKPVNLTGWGLSDSETFIHTVKYFVLLVQ